jgi:HEAT repeat protein
VLKWLTRWLAGTDPQSHYALSRRVRSPEPEVRRKAAEVLGGIAEPWACEELFVLLKDVMAEVHDTARAALRQQGTAATAVLIRALEDADPKVAVPAADLLGELKDLDAVRPLLLVMKFGTVEIRAAATRALIRYGRSAIPGLILACQDPDPWTRTRGEAILAEIRSLENAAPAPSQPVPSPHAGAEGAPPAPGGGANPPTA